MAMPISSLPKDGVLLIEGNKINGLGDISATFKLASLLKSQGIPLANIVISLADKTDAALFNTEGFTVISMEERSRVSDVAMQIFFPDIRGYVHPGTPILRIDEYDRDLGRDEGGAAAPVADGAGGKTAVPYVHLGLGGLGLIIDAELRDFARSSPDASVRAVELHKASAALQEALFHGDFAKFAERTNLYVGHVSSFKTALSFFKAIALFNKSNEKDIHICLPKSLDKFPPLSAYFKGEFKGLGIGKVIIQTFDTATKTYKEAETIVVSEEGGDKKTVTITLGSFSQHDMKCLWKASENETIVTGDQSLSEAISACKSFVYESLVHKRYLTRLLWECYQRLKTATAPNTIMIGPDYTPEALLSIFEAHRADAYRSIHNTEEFIFSHHDCSKSLIEVFNKIFRKQIP